MLQCCSKPRLQNLVPAQNAGTGFGTGFGTLFIKLAFELLLELIGFLYPFPLLSLFKNQSMHFCPMQVPMQVPMLFQTATQGLLTTPVMRGTGVGTGGAGTSSVNWSLNYYIPEPVPIGLILNPLLLLSLIQKKNNPVNACLLNACLLNAAPNRNSGTRCRNDKALNPKCGNWLWNLFIN